MPKENNGATRVVEPIPGREAWVVAFVAEKNKNKLIDIMLSTEDHEEPLKVRVLITDLLEIRGLKKGCFMFAGKTIESDKNTRRLADLGLPINLTFATVINFEEGDGTLIAI